VVVVEIIPITTTRRRVQVWRRLHGAFEFSFALFYLPVHILMWEVTIHLILYGLWDESKHLFPTNGIDNKNVTKKSTVQESQAELQWSQYLLSCRPSVSILLESSNVYEDEESIFIYYFAKV